MYLVLEQRNEAQSDSDKTAICGRPVVLPRPVRPVAKIYQYLATERRDKPVSPELSRNPIHIGQ